VDEIYVLEEEISPRPSFLDVLMPSLMVLPFKKLLLLLIWLASFLENFNFLCA